MGSVALVIGAGDALGGSIARRFAREGYATVVVRRHLEELSPLVDSIKAAGGTAYPFACDAPGSSSLSRCSKKSKPQSARCVVVFNVGGNVLFDVVETTA